MREWCNIGLYMKAGKLVQMGPIAETLAAYKADVRK